MKTIADHDVKIFTDNIESSALGQIEELMNLPAFSGCKVRIMPDVHTGAGCVIGFTGDLGDKVIPNIVGVDIGCGMRVLPFQTSKDIDFHAFNEWIVAHVPSGRDVRENLSTTLTPEEMDIYRQAKSLATQLRCYRDLKDQKRIYKSIGTLGGGNHFIELDKDEDGKTYLVVHTGSRNLGKQVAEIYQKLAIKNFSGWDELMQQQRQMIEEYKAAGRKSELQEAIKQLHNSFKMRKPSIPEELCWLEGESREDYLHDMRLCQEWAVLNRKLIVSVLSRFFTEVECEEQWESVHNYIGADNIIRKGAISAREGERCIIPLNMRDGSLLCRGKGNDDWNCSAPHGAGRVLSRTQAYNQVSLDEFQQSMKGIYSETVNDYTRDESPMVYKPAEEIIENVAPTAEVERIIKPVFNYKASK